MCSLGKAYDYLNRGRFIKVNNKNLLKLVLSEQTVKRKQKNYWPIVKYKTAQKSVMIQRTFKCVLVFKNWHISSYWESFRTRRKLDSKLLTNTTARECQMYTHYTCMLWYCHFTYSCCRLFCLVCFVWNHIMLHQRTREYR